MELKKQTMYFAIETLTVFSDCFVSCHLMKLVTGRLCVLAFPYQCRVCIHSCSLIFHVLIQNKLYHGRASNFSGFAFENVALDSVSCCGTWEILSSFPTTSWWDRKWPFATSFLEKKSLLMSGEYSKLLHGRIYWTHLYLFSFLLVICFVLKG